MTLSVSIVVPIHDMYRKLNHLNSLIIELPLVGTEIILIDDFSSEDASLEIKSLIAQYPTKKVKLVQGYFGSPGAARNAGLSKATGDWIVFTDSDDRLHLSAMLNHLLTRHADQVQIFQFRKIDFNSGKVLEPVSETDTIFDLVFNLGLWRMAFPAKFLREVSFNNLRMGEDILFFLDVFRENPDLQFVSIHTYDYVMGLGNQLTSNVNAIEDLFNLLEELDQRIDTVDDAVGLVRFIYIKNTLSAIKHLGFIKSRKYARKSFMLITRSSFDEKRSFFHIFKRLMSL